MNLFDIGDGIQGQDANDSASRASCLDPQSAACLKRGGLLLTGNTRAARVLRLAHADEQRRNGLEAWAAPKIYDWAGWMASLWNQLLLTQDDVPLLLTPLQELALWKRVVEQHEDARLVVSLDGMAELAQSAYERLSLYDAHGSRKRLWDHLGSTDAEAFRLWAGSFDALCSRQRWLSRSALDKRMSEAISAGSVDLPHEALLIGFDRVLPAQQLVLDALKAAGAEVSLFEGTEHQAGSNGVAPQAPLIVAAKDQRDEIATCASWARRTLLIRPGSRIAVIVQDVAAVRGRMERIFRSILLPASLSIMAPAAAPLFEFSLGRPLASVPLVRAALLLLQWLTRPLPQEEVSWLLLSGFFAGRPGELLALATLDALTRKTETSPPEITLDWWLRHCRSDSSEAAAGLRKRLAAAYREAAANEVTKTRSAAGSATRGSKKTYSEWMDIALEILTGAGWPGADAEDSAQFQARKKWEQFTASIAALAFDGVRVEYDDFLTALLHAAGQTIFAPQSRNAPIQIMGPLESAGQDFDAVWFMGLDDLKWPAKASPHPLLPLAIQRDAGMPHATPEIDWEFARAVTQRIVSSSPECVFSYAKHSDGALVQPAPVLAAALGSMPAFVEAEDFLRDREAPPLPVALSRVVEIIDTSSIPWPVTEVAGGADIVKMQAACPFKAFATRRLGAQNLDDAERGLTPLDRGNILHNVLCSLWDGGNDEPWRLQTRDDLFNARAAGRLTGIIEHHVEAALTKWADANDPWKTAFLQNEHRRLCGLLTEWLALETQRQPFTVEAREQKLKDVHVGDLKLDLRVDRIDRLPSGDRLLFDYKTTREISALDWKGERPDEPQLPLYATFGGVEKLKGVLFAKIRPHDMEFLGHIADKQELLDRSLIPPNSRALKPYDSAVLTQWKDTLSALAEDFLSGNATVTPKDYPSTCEYCALPSLCRIAETKIPVESSEIDPPESDYSSGNWSGE